MTLQWEFYIADRLGMTVSDMRDRMTHTELTHWIMYHQKRAQDQELDEKKQKRRAR